MPLKLMYITNNPMIAMVAEDSGVDRIWIDLEYMGKEMRQHGMNTVKSNHQISDVARIRSYIKKSELMVRVNPLHEKSKEEIDSVIDGGADLIMLPMFHTEEDVRKYVDLVSGRTRTMLLVETKEAYENLEKIVRVPGINEIHIGLNDLHLAYEMVFMFEPLANGMIDKACKIIKAAKIPFGFGGVARIGEGLLPAEYIIGEHYRLGSSMVILSRTFCDTWTGGDKRTLKRIFEDGVKEIREHEESLTVQNEEFFEKNKKMVCKRVSQVVGEMKEKRRSFA